MERNVREVLQAVADGNYDVVASKVKRGIAILREKNQLSTLEAAILNSVEKAVDTVI